MSILFTFLITFQLILLSNAEGRFLKIENCTTTNKSLTIERCDITNGNINVIAEIFRPLNQIFVHQFHLG